MKKYLLSTFFILALAITVMFSCKGENVNNVNNNVTTINDKDNNNSEQDLNLPADTGGEDISSENGEADSEDSQTRIEPNLPPDAKFDGYVFNIMVSGISGTNAESNDFYSETDAGNPIPDAVYYRNIAVEEKLGIKINAISVHGTGQGKDALQRSISAQDNSYDAAIIGAYGVSELAMKGYLADLNSVPWIDLKKTWWDQKAVRDLTIKDMLFYVSGDYSTVNMNWTFAILFNKKLRADYKIEEDFYELVNTGKWTVDKFAEFNKQVSADLNGDGKMDENDRYGALVWDDSMMGIVNAAGGKCASVNAEGELELTMYSERIASMFEKYTSAVYNKSTAFAFQRKEVNGSLMFEQDQGLFYMTVLSPIQGLRAMETDFGILPYFKYDEAQEEYYHTVASYLASFLCVPGNQSDDELERTGIILEAIAAESHYTVRPAYYDISLKGKHARDVESLAMLDIILETRAYDLGWYYQIGNFNEKIMNLLRSYKTGFTSMYDRSEVSAQATIDKINNNFDEFIN